MPAVIPSCDKELHDVEQIAGMLPVHCRDQLAAMHILERYQRDFEIRLQRAARIQCQRRLRTGRTVPRMTKLTSMAPWRTSSLVSPVSAEAGTRIWKPCFFP